MRKKNILTAAVSLSLVACLSIGATLAYFTDSTESKENTFTTGKVKIGLVDELPVDATFNTTWTAEQTEDGIEYGNIQPGDTLDKIVGVTVNEDSSNAYVAMQVVVDGSRLPDGYGMLLAEQLQDKARENDWAVKMSTEGMDIILDCFYQGEAIGGQYVELFKSVEIPANWGNELINIYGAAAFKIDVKAAAVQSANLEVPNWVTQNESYNQLMALLNEA